MSNSYQQNFLRYEFKYLVRDMDLPALEESLSHFMTLDPFAEKMPDKNYFIRSLYFDTDNYSCFFEKVTGVKYRKKFRIRTYSRKFEKDVPFFLELKGRDNYFVFKERQLITSEDADRFCMLHDLPNSINSDGDNHTYEKFLLDVFKKQIKPKVIIDYTRKPFVSKYDYEFRVTLDSNVTAIESSHINQTIKRANIEVKPGYTIVEIKFRRSVPYWFTDIVRRFQLKRLSISKYCEGVEALGLCSDD